MGRKRTAHHYLPPRMHLKKGRYYHVTTTLPRKWTPLGDDLNEARKKWAELECEKVFADDKTFSCIGHRYMREVLPALKPNTQRDYTQYFKLLDAVFGVLVIDIIRPYDIAEYLRVRGETSKVRANREKALFSTIFNHARAWGIKKSHVTGTCLTHEYAAVWAASSGRAEFNVTDIVDGSLSLTQNKMGDFVLQSMANFSG